MRGEKTLKTERWQAINHHLVIDEASKKAVIVKDKDKKILNDPLAVKTLVDTEGQPVKTARTKLIRDTLRSKIKLEPLSVKRQFNDKGEYENAKKAENLLSNRPAEQYKQVKAELKFFGQSFLEGFLGFYGLEVDNALAEYENTLQVLEEQELGQPDKSYYIGVFKKGEAQKVTDEMYSREFAEKELKKFNDSLTKEQAVKEEVTQAISQSQKLERE